MNVVALLSGGKDSVLSAMECARRGHKLVCFANLRPPPAAPRDSEGPSDAADCTDIDSYCFQTVGFNAVAAIAECANVPLRTRVIRRGQSVIQSLVYDECAVKDARCTDTVDEIEVLFELLQDIIREFPEINAVSSGAILSDYQRLRVESVAARLGLASLAYLWQASPESVLAAVRDEALDVRIVKVATMGLTPQKHLGKELAGLSDYLQSLAPHVHPAGEGGEYETIVLDSPLFRSRRLQLRNERMVMVEDNAFAPVAHLVFDVSVVDKSADAAEHAAAFLDSCAAAPPSLSLVDDEISPVLRDIARTDAARLVFQPLAAASSVAPLGTPADVPFISDDCSVQQSLRASGIQPGFAGSCAEALPVILEAALARRGGNALGGLYFVLIHSPSMREYDVVNAAYTEFFRARSASGCLATPPARAFVAVAALSELVVDVYFAAEGARRTALHVQSHSCWAAPCVGPYAQVNTLQAPRAGDGAGGSESDDADEPQMLMLHVVSGRVGMVPSTQELYRNVAEPPTSLDDHAASRFLSEFVATLHNAIAPVALLAFGWTGASDFLRALQVVTHVTFFITDARFADASRRLWALFTAPSKSAVRVVVVSALPKGAVVEALLQVWPPGSAMGMVPPMYSRSYFVK